MYQELLAREEAAKARMKAPLLNLQGEVEYTGPNEVDLVIPEIYRRK